MDTPVNVYLKLPVTEISKIDDQRSVSNLYLVENAGKFVGHVA